jgi:hypothetical protein
MQVRNQWLGQPVFMFRRRRLSGGDDRQDNRYENHQTRDRQQRCKCKPQHDHERRQQMPLDAHEHRRQERSLLAIDRLKKTRPEHTVIDHIVANAYADLIAAVDSAAPTAGAERIEVVRVLEFQQRFSFAVTALLLEIRLNGIPPIVPRERSRS